MSTKFELASINRRNSKTGEIRETSVWSPKPAIAACVLCLLVVTLCAGQDVPNSKDPAGMKRYEGSELIGYRAPKFDEYLLPLGPPTSADPPAYEKSKPIDGQVSYYTYLAPAGRTPAELFRNYKQEFQRLGIDILYEKGAGQHGWFGPAFDKIAADTDLSQILGYGEADERIMVGKSSRCQSELLRGFCDRLPGWRYPRAAARTRHKRPGAGTTGGCNRGCNGKEDDVREFR